MSLELIDKEKARFRIVIKDLKTGKSKTVSLKNHDKFSVEDIREVIKNCFGKNI